jgi:hypothetical protein
MSDPNVPGGRPDVPPGQPQQPGQRPDVPPGQDQQPGGKPDVPPGQQKPKPDQGLPGEPYPDE